MNDFIEAMIKGHDKTEYRWISGNCSDMCFICDSNNDRIINYSSVIAIVCSKLLLENGLAMQPLAPIFNT